MEYALRLNPNAHQTTRSSLFQSRDAYRELLGVCEGLLADSEINEVEANYLKTWIERHPQQKNVWPFDDLLARLDAMFADGIASLDECKELASILNVLLGERVVHNDARLVGAGIPGPTQLIFDDPPPSVTFADHEFCATGTFSFGQRKAVEKAIQERGGTAAKAPRSETNYVLVGSFVSPKWANGNYGTKIERAMSLRKSGVSIAIIGEEHWKTFLA